MKMQTVAKVEQMGKFRRQSKVLCKEMFRYAKAHPDKGKSMKYLIQAKKDFKRYSRETDPVRIEEALRKGEARLSFLRMQVPIANVSVRHRVKTLRNGAGIDALEGPARNETWLTVDEESGEVALGVSHVMQRATFMNWRDGNIDPDERRKNDHLLERFHYRGPYWEKRRQGWIPQENIDAWSGPSVCEALLNRDKFDLPFDFPTNDILNHPEVKGNTSEEVKLQDMYPRRNDCIGVSGEKEAEVIVQRPDQIRPMEEMAESMQQTMQQTEMDRITGMPDPIEFMQGHRH